MSYVYPIISTLHDLAVSSKVYSYYTIQEQSSSVSLHFAVVLPSRDDISRR